VFLKDRALRALAGLLIGAAYAAEWIESRARAATIGCGQAAILVAAGVSPEYNARLDAARFKRIEKQRAET
jgi:hypothetical protein